MICILPRLCATGSIVITVNFPVMSRSTSLFSKAFLVHRLANYQPSGSSLPLWSRSRMECRQFCVYRQHNPDQRNGTTRLKLHLAKDPLISFASQELWSWTRGHGVHVIPSPVVPSLVALRQDEQGILYNTEGFLSSLRGAVVNESD